MGSMKRLWVWLFLLAAVLAGIGLALIPGGAKQEFEVAKEFEREVIVPLPSIGPVDLSITKGVAYLFITVAVVVVLAIVTSRILKHHPGRLQLALESLYDLARSGIVGSVMTSGQETWFPYIGSVFFFILISNLVGLFPLPFGEHHQPAFYAATANINVTIVLALFTFVFTQYAGIKQKGLVHYVASWAPQGAPPVLKQVIWGIHAISEVFRLISLSVRLFANMVAGHAILAVFFAMALIFQSYLIYLILQGASVAIYMFEIFVAFIQAFIFAILSAVYIGGAMEDH
jgi:F-type H+-transporting ATPase subunit a